jgi:release factor glutamine methyltransferase
MVLRHTWTMAEDGIVARLRAAGCVFAEDEARLIRSAAEDEAKLELMVAKRAAGFPLEHVLGWAEFCGLRIATDPGVFVPRVRTEFLIRQAAALTPPDAVALDLCCGSGAMGAALAASANLAELHAADIDPVAVNCATRNLATLGGAVYLGDLYQALPGSLRGRVDILIANVPYVPSDEIALLPAEARLHEARIALDGGADGLDILREVAAGAPDWLAPGGHVLIETGDRQAADATETFATHGLSPRLATSAKFGATVVIGAVTIRGSETL